MVYVAIRVRGTVNIKPDIKKTLQLLRLNKVNHCVLLEENPVIKGMLQVVKDYITWGEIDKEVLTKLIHARGKLKGDVDLTDDHVKSATSFANIEKLSKAIFENKFRYKEVVGVKPVFRLNPPKKGYEGIKRSFVKKGSLGYRGNNINPLLERMI